VADIKEWSILRVSLPCSVLHVAYCPNSTDPSSSDTNFTNKDIFENYLFQTAHLKISWVFDEKFDTVRRWRYYTSTHYTRIYLLLLYDCWAITHSPKSEDFLRIYFVLVWINCSVMSCSHSNSTARPHVADGGTTSSYRRYLQIYSINSRVQRTRGGNPVCILVKVLTAHCKNVTCYGTCHKVSDEVAGFVIAVMNFWAS
jgi:hypothetical protein